MQLAHVHSGGGAMWSGAPKHHRGWGEGGFCRSLALVGAGGLASPTRRCYRSRLKSDRHSLA